MENNQAIWTNQEPGFGGRKGRGGPGVRRWARRLGKGGQGAAGGGKAFGRFVGDGDLRLIVLFLLSEEPRHGYDFIKTLEERSSGFYSPSPGVVYPTLTYLEEVGHAVSTAEGTKKVYSITEAGRAHLEENREAVEAILGRIKMLGERMAQARSRAETSDEGPKDRDMPGVIPELNQARFALKTALTGKRNVSPEEQQRIAGVLRRAASEIEEIAQSSPDSIDL